MWRQIYYILAECPQCYFEEISQMLAFFINLNCLKSCPGTDHLTQTVECHGKTSRNPAFFYHDSKPGHRGLYFRSCELAESNIFSGHRSSVMLSFKRTELFSLELHPRTDFRGCGFCFCNLLSRTNKFGPGTVLMSCLVF